MACAGTGGTGGIAVGMGPTAEGGGGGGGAAAAAGGGGAAASAFGASAALGAPAESTEVTRQVGRRKPFLIIHVKFHLSSYLIDVTSFPKFEKGSSSLHLPSIRNQKLLDNSSGGGGNLH